PSGEKIGAPLRPWPATRRRAVPPSRGTVQISPANSNAMVSRETVGWRSRRGEPAANEGATEARAMRAGARIFMPSHCIFWVMKSFFLAVIGLAAGPIAMAAAAPEPSAAEAHVDHLILGARD